MKTIGLIGGMSWESTVPYYRLINETVKEQLGGLRSAKLVLYSIDLHEIEELQRRGDWETAGLAQANAARSLEAAGASFLVLCTNIMHKVAHYIEAAVAIKLLHIADPTATEIKKSGHSVVGLLGTRSPWSKPSTRRGCSNGMASKSKSLQAMTATSFIGSSMKSCASEL